MQGNERFILTTTNKDNVNRSIVGHGMKLQDIHVGGPEEYGNIELPTVFGSKVFADTGNAIEFVDDGLG